MALPSEAVRDKPAAETLQVRLFGTFTLLKAGVPLPATRTRKGQWLLALLLLRKGQAVDRVWLAATLWPDSMDTQAKENLRTSLKDLRHVLGAEAVRLTAPTPRTLAFDTTDAECDLFAFDAAVSKGDIAALEGAMDLYHGELLEGCDSDWVFPERQARAEAYLAALESLSENALALQSADQAVHYLRQIVTRDPLRESAWQRLMRALALSGDEAAVTQTYQQLRLLLRKTLNIAPTKETTALYQELNDQARNKKTPTSSFLSPNIPHTTSLPRPLTPIIGRNPEIEAICDLLTKARLVTLTGIGGIGKTRLAIAAAEHLNTSFPMDVFFVPLMDVAESERLSEVVRDGLGLPRTPNADPFLQIVDKLSTGPCLLVLDNFEHLLESGTVFVQKLLPQIPTLTILLTSRQALHLRGEQEFPVLPLSVPANEGQTLEQITESASVQLFLTGAKARRPAFEVTSGNASAIAGLCRRLDGLPLAIELASAWVHLLTPAQMLTRLSGERFSLLVSTHKDRPERHRTMRAAIDWGFHLLEQSVQEFAVRLSIFRGGWSAESAQAVCGEPKALEYLRHLYDVSLVQVEERGDLMRYRYLETIREYAAEQLTDSERQELAKSHMQFFLDLLAEADPHLKGAEQREWLDRLDAEQDNLRAALVWCREAEGQYDSDLRLTLGLWRFWYKRGYFSEGLSHFRAVLSRQEAQGRTRVRAMTLNAAGVIAYNIGDYPTARMYLEESLDISRELGDKREIGFALDNLGHVALEQCDYDTARIFQEEALALAREVGDKYGLACILGNMALGPFDQGDYDTAYSLMEEALLLYREIEDIHGTAAVLRHLADVAYSRGRLVEARALLMECLPLLQQSAFRPNIAYFLETFASIHSAEGQGERAAQLWGAAESLREVIGASLPPNERPRYDGQVAASRAAFGEGFPLAWQEGRTLTPEQAIVLAVENG